MKTEDCPKGQICEGGICRTGCTTTEDCPKGQICEGGICRTGCTTTEDCPENQDCITGDCLPRCVDADQDGYGENCAAGADCDDQNANIHPGVMEVCGDKIDNDCDTQTDEDCVCTPGMRRLCSSLGDPYLLKPPMRCQPGTQVCVNGAWGGDCAGEIGPVDEICNGIDDNCDGAVDEGLLNAVGQCSGAVPPESCGPTGEGNGLDDNGNGQVDEGCSCEVPPYDPDLPRTGQPCYSGPIFTLGVGVCHGGTRDCQPNGTWGACQSEVLPKLEICGDNQDNDCDGQIDEGCAACTPEPAEICDGRDNDCDGVIDEGVVNACGTCAPPVGKEVCDDGLDNDCNGVIDDSCSGGCTSATGTCYPGPPETAGVGQCTVGHRECDGEFWSACHDYVLPTLETCGAGPGDGVDNDCDGQTDEGCGCTEGAVRPCGSATGICTQGQATCTAHVWGACTGGTGPNAEVCDGLDNDCDGLVDEDVLNACGKCDEPCYDQDVPPDQQGQGDQGIVVLPGNDPNNPTGRPGITLTEASFIPPYLWAANHDYDSVSKFNTDLAQEEGRYWVGDNPSRTVVDFDGNMWVGGRNDGRLTKVLWNPDSCPDRNGDGTITTSRLQNGVVTQVNSAADPFADECVVYSAVSYPARPSIRGLSAGPDGKIWIGYTAGGLQWIDPVTFALGPFYPGNAAPRFTPDTNGVQQPTGGSVDTGGVYGMVIDSQGNLYTSQNVGRTGLAHFNIWTGQWVGVYEGLCGSYGIAVDAHDRVWLGSWPHCGGVNMYDPAQRKHYSFLVPQGVGPSPGLVTGVTLLTGNVYAQVKAGAPAGTPAKFATTGISVEPATGNVWTSFYPIGYTGRLVLNEADLSQSTFTYIGTTKDAAGNNLPGVGVDLRGVGFDHNGFAWTLGLCGNSVYKLDPATNRRAADLPNGKPVGVGAHYTYSDFTGSTALSFTSPRGYWEYIFATGFARARADLLVWEAYVPASTTAGIRVRAVDAANQPLTGWLPPENMGVAAYFDYPSGQAQATIDLRTQGGPLWGAGFEVQIRMTTLQRDVRPIVNDVQIKWQRP